MMSTYKLTTNKIPECYSFFKVLANIYYDIGKELSIIFQKIPGASASMQYDQKRSLITG
jgi:hypothetical protein